MPTGPVERFLRTLQLAEQSGDVGPLVELFTDDAELAKTAGPGPERGRDGARRFWESYLRAFDRVRSEFTRVIESDGLAVLAASSGSVPTTIRRPSSSGGSQTKQRGRKTDKSSASKRPCLGSMPH